MVTPYVIEVRNKPPRPGDCWQKWGGADTEDDAQHCETALRAAMGSRYEVRRRQIQPAEGSQQ